MKLILTDRQARLVLEALEWAENPDYGDYDPANAAYIRIENKIRKELGMEQLKQGDSEMAEKVIYRSADDPKWTAAFEKVNKYINKELRSK